MFWKKTGRHTNTTARFPILFELQFYSATASGASTAVGIGICFHQMIPGKCLSSTTNSITRIEGETRLTISILSAMSIMMSGTKKLVDQFDLNKNSDRRERILSDHDIQAAQVSFDQRL